MSRPSEPPCAATAGPDAERRAARLRMRWTAGLARLAPAPLALAIAAPLLGGLLLIVQADLLASVLHRAVRLGEGRAALALPVAGLAALLLLRAAIAAAGEAAAAIGAERAKALLRQRLVAHLLAAAPDHGPDHGPERASGALAALVTEGVEALHGFLAEYLPALVAATLLPLAVAVAVAVVGREPVAGALLLVTAPLIPLFMALVGWGAEAAHRSHLQAFQRLSGLFADRLRGLLAIRLFGRGAAEAEALAEAGDALSRRTLGVMRIAFLSSAVLEFFAALGVAGVALAIGLAYLGLLPGRGTGPTLETGLFCLLLAPEVYAPLRRFATHYHDRAGALAFAAEAERLLGRLPAADAPRRPQPAISDPPAGPLAVRTAGLTVTPPGRAAPVLEGCALAVAPGQRVALLGASGAGKSTLLEALAGLRPARGTIEIGGVDLGEIEEEVLRARVAILPQRPHLFAGTIADNIRLGLPEREGAEADDEPLLSAARRAGVTLFADRLPDGLATPVGEGGLGLSGGERQRVALARIYMRDPDLVLLDEPTAHLDAATEALVLDGLLDFARERTLVVATHAGTVASRMDAAFRVVGGTVLPALLRPQPMPRRGRRSVA